MMHMTFYWSKEVTLLFSTWSTTTTVSYSLSLLACFLASFSYQLLESLRIRLIRLNLNASSPAAAADSAARDSSPLLASKTGGADRWKFEAFVGRAREAALFGVNAGLGYMLMLAVMSFNGGVFLSVVLGLAVGYFAFRCGGVVEVATAAAVVEIETNTCACA